MQLPGNDSLLLRQRTSTQKQFQKLEDYDNLSASRLRYYAKRLGIAKCMSIHKKTLIFSLLKFDSNHRKEIASEGNTHLRHVVPARRSLRKKRPLTVCAKHLDGGTVREKTT